ncbi:hypothetical protein QAD02_002966 [Eretmocerus hayati]|uniref:Uncharacterized protein n=1 Tax=Eretmocerus hayati TaxID=131215 RepID=A0ACC2NKS7_9HYME|nr:hypothetical protein QAD02_002966 [Eretmocerus hayati]
MVLDLVYRDEDYSAAVACIWINQTKTTFKYPPTSIRNKAKTWNDPSQPEESWEEYKYTRLEGPYNTTTEEESQTEDHDDGEDSIDEENNPKRAKTAKTDHSKTDECNKEAFSEQRNDEVVSPTMNNLEAITEKDFAALRDEQIDIFKKTKQVAPQEKRKMDKRGIKLPREKKQESESEGDVDDEDSEDGENNAKRAKTAKTDHKKSGKYNKKALSGQRVNEVVSPTLGNPGAITKKDFAALRDGQIAMFKKMEEVAA